MDIEKILFDLCDLVRPHLNERQRRLLIAAAARSLGRGGVSRISRLTGVSRTTIHQGVKELGCADSGEPSSLPARRPGGGRKRATVVDPGLLSSLKALMAAELRESDAPLNWTCRSTRQLAAELAERGHPVSHMIVAELLHQLGFHLYGNARVREEGTPSEREAQFRFVNQAVNERVQHQKPVLAIELRCFCCRGGGEDEGGEAPYVHGSEDEFKRAKDEIEMETIRFAAEAVYRWRNEVGEILFPGMRRLLLCVGGGGSAAWSANLWKGALQKLAVETGLAIDVCHIPPGTLKWRRIDHQVTHSIRRQWMSEHWSCCEVTIKVVGGGRKKDRVANLFGPEVPEKPKRDCADQTTSFHELWNYSL